MDEPVSFVKGATAPVRKAWESLGIKTVGDLLLSLPRRYDDFSRITSISEAQNGDYVTLRGKVVKCIKLNTFRKRFAVFRLLFEDTSGKIAANFFNQPWVLEEFKPGREIFLSGKIQIKAPYGKTLSSPIWEPAEARTLAAGKVAPVYGLAGTLIQKTYRRLMQQVLEQVEWPEDPLSMGERTKLDFLGFADAVRAVHEPADAEEAEKGRARLAFDEVLGYQLALGAERKRASKVGAPAIAFDQKFAKKFVESLPYPLTGDQKKAVWASLQDMEKKEPMRRLIQGDVGSGKTVVAAFLAAHVYRQGQSAALLAPTDILARQHALTFQRLFAQHGIPFALVTRTEKRLYQGREEQPMNAGEIESLAEQGNIIFVGTHAILENGRLPKDLALAVVDEQHRFGVGQRERLVSEARRDGHAPHLLSMTATPIPRTLALTLYGDLDISLIVEKPAGRLPIKTMVCPGTRRETAYQAIKDAVQRKEKAYIVCPLIDPSDALGASSVTEEWKRLSKGPLEGLSLGLLHGKLKPKEKEEVMERFKNGDLHVLIATSVIEVGVDVPQATVIAIEGAERFGLAQLHQLRGRVGRSSLPSFCYLLTDAEGAGLDRLLTMERVQDGFRLAEEDLKLRGGGNLLGTQQSGHEALTIARITDGIIISQARTEAKRILESDPDLTKHPIWKKAIEGMRNTAHLE
jgi:ATP-dependent DNA helicase RecG